MMRALVASNVLARREGTVLFVPVNPSIDPRGRSRRRCSGAYASAAPRREELAEFLSAARGSTAG